MEKINDMIEELHKMIAVSSLGGEEYRRISDKLIELKWELKNMQPIPKVSPYSCINPDDTNIA